MEKIHKPTQRVLNILTYLSEQKEGASLTDIASGTNIAKSTLSPILKTMTDMNFIEIHNGNHFVGINAFKVGESFIKSNDIYIIIKKYMKEIVDNCNEICQLGIYNNKEVLYIAKIESEQPIQLVSSVGKSLPAYATAIGKSLLSQFSDEELKEIYKDGFEKFTENTIDSIDELIRQVDFCRKEKYTLDFGEITKGVNCVGVPIEQNGEVVAAISVSIPFFRANTEKLDMIKTLLFDYKKRIEINLKSFDTNINEP